MRTPFNGAAAVFAGFLAAVAAVACLSGARAEAAIITGTFSGTIIQGFDTAGVFGHNNTFLDGLPYAGTFTYDTSKGHRTTTSTEDRVEEGTLFGGGDPVFTYALTINGVTDNFSVAADSFVITSSGAFQIGGRPDVTSDAQIFDIAYGDSFEDLDHPHSFADTMTGLGTPYYGGALKLGFQSSPIYIVVFDTQRVDFSTDATTGVPEPSSWVMMLAGLLGVGGVLRSNARNVRPRRFGVRSTGPGRLPGPVG